MQAVHTRSTPDRATRPRSRGERSASGPDSAAKTDGVAIRDPISEQAALDLAELFRSLGDVSRVRMIAALSARELTVGELADVAGISESAASHQLRGLRQMRLVRPRRDGRYVHYSLDDSHVLDLFRQGLEHVEHRNE